MALFILEASSQHSADHMCSFYSGMCLYTSTHHNCTKVLTAVTLISPFFLLLSFGVWSWGLGKPGHPSLYLWREKKKEEKKIKKERKPELNNWESSSLFTLLLIRGCIHWPWCCKAVENLCDTYLILGFLPLFYLLFFSPSI